MAEIDIKSVPRNELGIMGGAFIAFIALFFPSYGVSGTVFGQHFSASVKGWHWTNFWLPVFLLLAAAALVGVRRFRGDLIPDLPVGTRVIVAGVSVLVLVWTVLRALTFPGGGHAFFGTYLLTIAVAVAAAFAVLDLRESGEKIPSMPKAPTAGSDTSA